MLRSALVTTLLLLVSCSSAEPDPAQAVVHSNPTASLAQGAKVTGISVQQFDELLGAPSPKPRIVNFWATWCPPCVAELPELEAFAAANPRFDVVLVNTDTPSLRDSKVVAFLEQRSITSSRNAAVDIDDQAGMLAAHVPEWPNAIPYTLLIDTDGRVARRFTTGITQSDLEAAASGL